MASKIDKRIIQELNDIVGPESIVLDEEKMLDFSHDESALKDFERLPDVVIKPKTAEQIARILRLANKKQIPITPRGGATGLCGGCIAINGGIVLSLEKMDRVIEIDTDNQMAVVEAGVTLMDFYEHVEEAGLFFPPHPGEESAMIGGLIATNAGGARAVKYGVIRNYVRGLEVVLPTGSVIEIGGKIMKSSTGYSLLHLMIGSEGTLGIITRATIQLMPSPQMTRTLIIPYQDLQEAIEAIPLLIKRKIMPLAVEFTPREVIEITEKFLKKRWPCSQGETYLIVIIDGSSDEEIDKLSEVVADVCLEKGALDVYVADTAQKQKEVLDIRSKIYEAIKSHTLEILDIVVPRAEIAKHFKRVQEVSKKYDIWLPTYGHAADGNVHTHIMRAKLEEGKMTALSEEEWRGKIDFIRKELYEDCQMRRGAISGEHGIGVVKKPYLSLILSIEEINLMRGIKRVFDPNGILNPGKIFDSYS